MIPESIESIGFGVFRGCVKLRRVRVPEGFTVGALAGAGLYALFGEDLMTALIGMLKESDEDERKVFYESYLASDTRAAVRLAVKRGELERFASLRGMSSDEILMWYLYDLGLGLDGRKSYELGPYSVTVRLLQDHSFAVELPNGKTAKSIPKSGADPELYEAACRDFAQLKKEVRAILKK